MRAQPRRFSAAVEPVVELNQLYIKLAVFPHERTASDIENGFRVLADGQASDDLGGFDGFHGAAHDSWRGKDYVAAHVGVLSLPCDPITLDNEDTAYFNPWPFFSHLEVVAGLGLTVRVGINAAEFFDLLVGFVALDPLHDDFPSASQRAATYRLPAMRLFTWHRAMCAA
jgi:hypothetical protein